MSEIKIIGDCPDEITGWIRHIRLEYLGHLVQFKLFYSQDYGYDTGVPVFQGDWPDELRLEFSLNYLQDPEGMAKLDALTFNLTPLTHRENRAKVLSREMIEMHRGTYIDLNQWPNALEVVKDYFNEIELYFSKTEFKGGNNG